MFRAPIATAAFVLSVVSEVVYVTSVTCQDMKGKEVDWFYVYKFPKIKGTGNVLVETGAAFLFLDSNQQTFQLSRNSIEEESHLLAFTVQQIYSPGRTIAHIMYNDQPPDGQTTSRGHTKGVVAYDSNDGFWIVHSVPRFPGTNGPYEYPKNGLNNGQSILCVSFNANEMEKIATQMLYTNPYVYSSNIPQAFQQIAPTFPKVINGERVESAPWHKKIQLQSRGLERFTHYAKYDKFGKDLYVDFIATDLDRTFFVETWKRGSGKLPSNCNHPYHVYNINHIRFSNAFQFAYTKDHSKWASSKDRQFICIADINRQESQFKRGGGALCASLPCVSRQYNDAISGYDSCPSRFKELNVVSDLIQPGKLGFN